jgi:hypothetical protein
MILCYIRINLTGMQKNFFYSFLVAIVLFATCFAPAKLLAQDSTIVTDDGPDTVRVGCYIISLHNFNFREKEYTARFWLWMLYDSPDIEFHDDVEIPNAKTLNFDAMVDDSTAGYKWIQLKITANMKQTWNVKDYPFDEQELQIIVENAKYDARTVVFVPDTVGQYYDPDFVVEGWDIKKFTVTTGVSHYATGFGDASLDKPESDYSKYIIHIKMARSAWGLFFKIFLGMYVAFAISIVSFWVDSEHTESRFALPVGGLFAAVGNKYIIDSYLPESSAFTTVDILHGATFVSIFITIAFAALSLKFGDGGNRLQSQKTDKVVRSILVISYVLFNVGVVIHALYS